MGEDSFGEQPYRVQVGAADVDVGIGHGRLPKESARTSLEICKAPSAGASLPTGDSAGAVNR